MSVRDALGVPAILRAVTLIANTAGALSLDDVPQRRQMDERPTLAIRPNPFTTPRDFFRDSAFHLATRGEAWWWVAAPRRRRPRHLARARAALGGQGRGGPARPALPEYHLARPRHAQRRHAPRHAHARPRPPLRGTGPLQFCGAAISVAVEAQEWAANFYAEGGYPSVY